MPNSPFDALRPFKSQPEEFTPHDTLPWARLAENLLKVENPEKATYFISSPQIVERTVKGLVKNLHLSPQAKILDIGCGLGSYSHRLAELGYEVTGIDIAQSFLDYAQNKAKQANLTISYRNLSMFELSFEAEFDAILLLNTVIRHLTLEQLRHLLSQLTRALKPKGHLIADFCMTSLTATDPIIIESLNFSHHSIWHASFHAYLTRELIFPASSEKVTHYLVLTENGTIQEYWSRVTLHDPATLNLIFTQNGFEVKPFWNSQSQAVLRNKHDILTFIWAEKE